MTTTTRDQALRAPLFSLQMASRCPGALSHSQHTLLAHSAKSFNQAALDAAYQLRTAGNSQVQQSVCTKLHTFTCFSVDYHFADSNQQCLAQYANTQADGIQLHKMLPRYRLAFKVQISSKELFLLFLAATPQVIVTAPFWCFTSMALTKTLCSSNI